MLKENNTEYYVINCDEFDQYELGGRINNILNTVNKIKPTATILEYECANLMSFSSIWCVFCPTDQVSISVGNSDITFNPLHKVLNFKVTIEEIQKRKYAIIKLKIVNKGGNVE